MKMQVQMSCCIVFLLVLSAVPIQALEALGLYDNFNTKFINPNKWFGSDDVVHESVREIQSSHLRLVNRTYGDTDRDSGWRIDSVELQFTHPDTITAIEGRVRVGQFEATGCPNSSFATGARVEITGSFFNIIGDVFASIRIERISNSIDPQNVLQVRAIVVRETPEFTLFGSHDLGPVRRGQEVRLRMQWDPNNDQFIFQRDDEPEVFSRYTVSDAAPPNVQRKALRIQNFVANCTTEPRPVGFMETFFDDVFVNQSAAPPPSGAVSLLTILPSSDAFITTQRFDLSLIVEAPGRSVVGGQATLNGTDVTTALVRCIIPGTLLTGGQTFRCPGLTGGLFGPGTHTLDVVLNLSDGSRISDTVIWEVLGNTEP